MDDEVDSLLVEVRAGTEGFARDIAAMRGTVDTTLLGGFERAGQVLERGLLGAIRRGSLGFEDLKRVALHAIDEIAAQAVRGLFAGVGKDIGMGGGGIGGIGGLLNLGGLLAPVLGLPGRATGGPVAPGRGYLVGERGPEMFVPTAAGRVETLPAAAAREVRVSITVAAPPGGNAPQALQRSSRQVASAVRRALQQY